MSTPALTWDEIKEVLESWREQADRGGLNMFLLWSQIYNDLEMRARVTEEQE